MINFCELKEPAVFDMSTSRDDRGVVFFNNEVSLAPFVRMYFVHNYRADTVRAWHGHLRESKLIIPTLGWVKVCALRIDDMQNDPEHGCCWSFWLDAGERSCCFIPPGYAHGHMITNPSGGIIVLSTSTLEQSVNDDMRWPVDRLFSPWARSDA